MKQAYFVTGIGTGIGKTVISAVLTEKLQADYWKPIQSGDLHASDTMTVRSLISNEHTRFHPEVYRLNTPLSPHQSAAIDGVTIDSTRFVLPETSNHLIVEGAGGLMVPLNENWLVSDLIRQLGLPVILVSRHYLGSINHTLMSWSLLQQQQIPVRGIIFNGDENTESKRYILQYTGMSLLGEIPDVTSLDRATVRTLADRIAL